LAIEITHGHAFQINLELVSTRVSDIDVDAQASGKKGAVDARLYLSF
jgi:hypothetical protein